MSSGHKHTGEIGTRYFSSFLAHRSQSRYLHQEKYEKPEQTIIHIFTPPVQKHYGTHWDNRNVMTEGDSM